MDLSANSAISGKLLRLAKWIVGIAAFLAVSWEAAHLYVHGMQAWAVHYGTSRGTILQLRLLGVPVLVLCLLCGALYASALARPGCFGGARRIWSHLAATYLLCLLGCVLLVRAEFLPLPDFSHEFELKIYLFVLLSLPVISFALALLAWVRLAFGASPAMQQAGLGPRE